MKKKTTLLKSLLVAAAMIAGVNGAWAADPDLENDYTLVKSVTWGGEGTNIAGSGACAHTAWDTGNKKQQNLTVLTAPTDAAGWIAMQAWTSSASGKGWWNRADNGLYCVNAGRSACVFGDDLTTGWLVIFECSQDASKVMTLTNGEGNPDGTFTYAASEDGKSYICTITAETNAYVGFCGNKNVQRINKISVYKPNNAVVATTYTVKFQDTEGNKLKDDMVYDGVGGSEISVTAADKATIEIDGNYYLYQEDDAEGKTVAEDGTTVVIVKFRKAATYSYTVNEVFGDVVLRSTSASSYESASITIPYRKYNAYNGQLYSKGASNKEYNYKFTLSQDGQLEKIAYSAVDGVNNVVFISEGEDIEGLTDITTGNTAVRSSNSASAYAPADTKIVTLAAGTYKIHAIVYDASKTPNSHFIFLAGETQIADLNCTTVNIEELTSEEFTLTEEKDIILQKVGGASIGLDAIYITGTPAPAPTTVAATITSECGFATFCSDKALDFSAVKGLTAYIVTSTEGVATLKKVTKVPAGTGLVLEGAVNTYDVPVIAFADPIEDNLLIAATTDHTAVEGDYVLAYQSEVRAFFPAEPDLTIAAGKAYLHIPAGSAPAFLPFATETTGISATLKNSEKVNKEVFNLNGQRVSQPTKGLYIVGGRKVVVK